jgi:hypothetical protein
LAAPYVPANLSGTRGRASYSLPALGSPDICGINSIFWLGRKIMAFVHPEVRTVLDLLAANAGAAT